MSLIRERYQEELALGNKSRILSTYGTWALLVLNSVVFLLTQLVLEPRKKERFERNLSELVRDQLALVNSELSASTESVCRELELIRAELAQSLAWRMGEQDQSSQVKVALVAAADLAAPLPTDVTVQELRRISLIDGRSALIGAAAVATVLLACLLGASRK